MIDIDRSGLVAALYSAINARGAPQFQMQNGIVPTVRLMDLEHSPFPPSRPFTVESFISAGAAVWSYLRVGVAPTAAAEMRLVISRVQLYMNDAATAVILWNVRDTGPGPITTSLRGHDFDRIPQIAGATPIRYDSQIGETYSEATQSATDPFGGLSSNAFFSLNGQVSDRDTNIVLRAGQELVVRNVNQNVVIAFRLEGRVYNA